MNSQNPYLPPQGQQPPAPAAPVPGQHHPQYGYPSPPPPVGGPVSGGPVSGAPDTAGMSPPGGDIGFTPPPPTMPHGPGMPPPVDLTGGSTEVKRPFVAVFATILLAVLALHFLIIAVLDVTEILYYTFAIGYSNEAVIMGAIYKGIMFFVAMLAAILTAVGIDFGRILGAGIAGASMWLACGAWLEIMLPLIDLNVPAYPASHYLRFVLPVLAGFFGIGALLTLAASGFSEWSVQRRKSKRA